MAFTFKGGIHPYDGKELSMNKAISDYIPNGEGIYPLSQHIGAPAAPIVKKGDRVLVGQKIAEAVVEGYKKIENGVVSGYKKIEKGAVDGFNKVSDKCIEKLNSAYILFK